MQSPRFKTTVFKFKLQHKKREVGICPVAQTVFSVQPISRVLRPCLFPGKQFPGNHFPNFPVFVCHQESWSTENTLQSTETENTFQSTETLFGQLGFVSKKVFSLLTVFVFRKVVSGKPLSKLSSVCLPLEKLVNGKHFPVKEKFGLVFRKVFS